MQQASVPDVTHCTIYTHRLETPELSVRACHTRLSPLTGGGLVQACRNADGSRGVQEAYRDLAARIVVFDGGPDMAAEFGFWTVPAQTRRRPPA
jgi:hypothetical protein